MLLSFRVSNFLSIKDEQEFSFVNDSTSSHTSAEDDGAWDQEVGTLAGIFGANASGKSNILKALGFMKNAVSSSYTTWASRDSIPVRPFALDAGQVREPSLFEAVFQVHDVRYQYGFRLTKEQVVGEWLYAYITHRRQVWFERDISSKDVWYFGKSFTGRNKVISDLTRPTTLFLSAAVANNHKMAMGVAHFFSGHLLAASPGDIPIRTNYTRGLSSNESQWNDVVELMKFADLGIRNARVRHETMSADQRQAMVRVFKALDTGMKDDAIDDVIDSSSGRVEFGHSVGESRKPIYLPLNAESLGTQIWFALVGPILRAINDGDILTVDEIDASLHPHLTSEILKIFNDPKRNPKQAQLLFTSHDTTLLGGWLGEKELSRNQVWFTEKKVDGSTVLYPLTDFSPRKTENLERGYLQGRYGAIPYLDRHVIDEVTSQVRIGEDHEFEPEADDLPAHDEVNSS